MSGGKLFHAAGPAILLYDVLLKGIMYINIQ